MSFNLLGRRIQEQLRIDEAYYNIFGRHPNYYDLPVFDPDIYDTHVSIALPFGQSNFTDEDIIHIAINLRNLDMPICGFSFYNNFLTFETTDGYFDLEEVQQTIDRYTREHSLPEIRVTSLTRAYTE